MDNPPEQARDQENVPVADEKRESNFSKYIPLGKKMPVQEAIDAMAAFHDATPEAVIAAFLNLKDFNEGTIEFRESVNNSTPCIVMEGKDANGTYKWASAINIHSGQPQAWVG